MGRASLYFTYRGRHFKDSVGPQIQNAIGKGGREGRSKIK